MERYNRAWRDPGSPLTPLTPLSTQIFKFETTDHSSDETTGKNTYRSLKPSHLSVPRRHTSRHSSHGPTRFSQSFLNTRSVFSPNTQSTTNGSSLEDGVKTGSLSTSKRSRSSASCNPTIKVKREPGLSDSTYSRFKHGSPVEHPTLSPRVRSLLNRTGNEHLTEMFTRQEIDIEVLIQMTLEDLEALGVRGARELKLAMEVIKFAKKFFR
ncbi:uncharacterized protein LOC117894164 isoform X2 [Drosophila subobscura]|uniref:uncharacterized protein LOC117894164 isoform X2 n=1 Tax=Drosophila subobscura TaxID=7241 RepID=UPI00155A20E0|nr:uncharacterized protein LOC117894164 isoform X2 [Drosophila subobscura]